MEERELMNLILQLGFIISAIVRRFKICALEKKNRYYKIHYLLTITKSVITKILLSDKYVGILKKKKKHLG